MNMQSAKQTTTDEQRKMDIYCLTKAVHQFQLNDVSLMTE